MPRGSVVQRQIIISQKAEPSRWATRRWERRITQETRSKARTAEHWEAKAATAEESPSWASRRRRRRRAIFRASTNTGRLDKVRTMERRSTTPRFSRAIVTFNRYLLFQCTRRRIKAKYNQLRRRMLRKRRPARTARYPAVERRRSQAQKEAQAPRRTSSRRTRSRMVLVRARKHGGRASSRTTSPTTIRRRLRLTLASQIPHLLRPLLKY